MSQSRGQLLVVDDNEMNRDLLLRRLSGKGFRVDAVEGGKQALAFLETHAVDVVLLDIEMPEMDGLEVLRRLRATHSVIELPVIVATARSESADVAQALELGANDYVTKPIDFTVTTARIETQVRLKRSEEARRISEERYELATAGSNDGIWDWDLRSDAIYYSARWKAMLGFEPEDVEAKPGEWFSRVHPDDEARLKADLQAHLDGVDSHFENEYRAMHRDGVYRWMLSRGLAVRDMHGKVYRIAGSQTDITAAKVADPLTGLPNRLLFIDRLSRLIERARRGRGAPFAVLFLDLDRFKLVNDSLGHALGDQLLIAFAQRLEQNLRISESFSGSVRNNIARLGGDEFAVLIDDLVNPESACLIGERLISALKQPFQLEGREVFVNMSIGVALSATGYERPEDMLRDADTAMYRAKTHGRGRVEVFDSEMRAGLVARLQLETELQHASERNEFRNVYQPIVSLKTGTIEGFEALVRWDHPTKGLVQPIDFIPAAEDIGVILQIGKQVLATACRQLAEWQRCYPLPVPLMMSVNVSARQFAKDDLTCQVREALQETGIEPSSLKLEITESMMMGNPDAVREMLVELKGLGVKIAIDDFGTGYASLSYLHRFPLDVLKIDRSFVSQIESNKERREIVNTILTLAKNLSLGVIAEGVETATQTHLLRELGCDWGQGYYFSRPLPVSSAEELLASQPNWLGPPLLTQG